MLFNPKYYRRLFPELMEFETDRARDDAWDRAVAAVLRSVSYYSMVVLLLGPLLGGLILVAILKWVPRYLQLPTALVIMAAVGAGLPLIAFRWRVRRVLRQHLDTQSGLICRDCGYNLTGLTEPRCPECGRPFDKARLSAGHAPTADDTAKDDN
jgi:hypothetical protein